MSADIPTPPEDLTTIIEKTANFVARLGVEFEKRIYANEKNNPKFSFLRPTDTFYPFYQKRIQDFRIELGPEAAPAPIPTSVSEAQAQEDQEAISAAPQDYKQTIQESAKHGPTTLAQRILAVQRSLRGKGADAPPPELFKLDLPDNITALDLDIIRLTAQFVAKNGHQFQSGLMNREQRNPQFDFLKQNHDFHSFFLGLVESYTRVILPPRNIVEKLKADYTNKQALLDRIITRHEWEKQQEKIKKAVEEQANQDQIANAMIDWHDFVIVETIDFEEEAPPVRVPEAVPAPDAEIEMETEMEMEVEQAPVAKLPPRANIIKPPPPPQAPAPPKPEDTEQQAKIEQQQDPKFRIQRQVMGGAKTGPSEDTKAAGVLPIPPRTQPPPPPQVPNKPTPPKPGVGILPAPPGINLPFQTEEPFAKKQKTEVMKDLVPEDKWLASHSGSVSLSIQIPKENEKLSGQTLTVSFDLRATVKQVMEKIADQVGVAVNKQKLKGDGLPFLKPELTLAYYNLEHGSVLQLGTKTRGGKK
jgi:hypothetical protein